MTSEPPPPLGRTPLPEPKPSRFTLNQKFTGIKSVVGSIFKFAPSFNLTLRGALTATAIVSPFAVAIVGESANAWDIIDTEPTAIEVIAIVEVDDGAFTLVPAAQTPSILQRILDASQRPIIVREASLELRQTLIQIGTIIDSLAGRLAAMESSLARIEANQVPTGPPVLEQISETVEENNCLLKSVAVAERVCP